MKRVMALVTSSVLIAFLAASLLSCEKSKEELATRCELHGDE